MRKILAFFLVVLLCVAFPAGGQDVRRRPLYGSSFSPDSLSNLSLWLKADAIEGLSDGDPVTTWFDQSSGEHDASQSTASKKPTYKVNVVNGKPVVRFDGVDDVMSFASALTYGNAVSIFIAVSPSTNTDDYVFSSSGAGGCPAIITQYSSRAFEWYNACAGGDRQTLSTSGTGFSIISVIQTDGSSLVGHYNGAQAFSVTPATAVSGSNITHLGALGTTQEHGRVDIGELIIYSDAKNSTDRDSVLNYLNGRYAVY